MVASLRNVFLASVCLIFISGHAWAVGLGKIEVTSHLGETFFAELPLQLDAGEKISDVFVSLANASDYQLLEVFRDPAINNLQVEIKNDLRGPRAVVSSISAVDTPYFNLVLKVRHGHATNFKKYPVFLDLPEQVRPVASAPLPVAPPVAQPVIRAPLPKAPAPIQNMPVRQARSSRVESTRTTESTRTEPASSFMQSSPLASPEQGSEFTPYEGWARTSRYGPMVHGDTITIVARRLLVDERYTLDQVMIGLFNKNRDKFKEGNINLINAGTYLEVPTAKELEAVDEIQAQRLLKDQNSRWKALKQQPRYALEAKAQENRYRPRVHIGKSASGEASSSLPNNQRGNATAPIPGVGKNANLEAQIRSLQEENLSLKQSLQESGKKASAGKPGDAESAAADAKVKKLELTVARLNKQLVQMNKQLTTSKNQDMNPLTYAMAGIILLLIALAGYMMFLLRRARVHPGMVMPVANVEPKFDKAPLPDEFNDDTEQSPNAEDVSNLEVDGQEGLERDVEEQLSTDQAENSTLSVADMPSGIADNELLFEDNDKLSPEAGVDYLAETEVYLRYGMETEALQQLRLAIAQQPGNAEAHAKMVEVLKDQGDENAVTAAIAAARLVLAGAALQTFETSLLGADSAESTSPDAAGGLEVSFAEDEPEAGVVAGEETIPAQAENVSQDEMEMDLSGIDLSSLSESDSAPEKTLNTEAEQSEAEPLQDETAATEEAFTSSIGISPIDEPEEENIETLEVAGDVDFTVDAGSSLDDDLSEALNSLDSSMDASKETPEISAADEALIAGTGTSTTPDDDLGLEEILGVTGDDANASQDGDVSLPETAIASTVEDDFNIDDILSELGIDENTAATAPTEEITSAVASGDGIVESDNETVVSGMDIGNELDDLLSEWDEGTNESGISAADAGADASPGNLGIDRARSLLAQGSLDEAESALQAAGDGERRADALIGQAELAARRGDVSRKAELLGEAETLVDDDNREWFESVKNINA